MSTPATHRVSMLEGMLLIRACEEALAARARTAPAVAAAHNRPWTGVAMR